MSQFKGHAGRPKSKQPGHFGRTYRVHGWLLGVAFFTGLFALSAWAKGWPTLPEAFGAISAVCVATLAVFVVVTN